MFEFSIAKKYLVPKKKNLSMSLIALMSIGVISLVVWLVLVFLSVTDGIEKSWLKKLTSFNAPIRITPKDAYYSSYYYRIDSLSSASNFTYKSIGEKLSSPVIDPYCPEEDMEVPPFWPQAIYDKDGSLKDLVKGVFASVDELNENLLAEDYEVTGAMMRLRMVRPGFSYAEKSQGYLTQASYIASYSEQSSYLHSLFTKPTVDDLNHLFFLADLSDAKLSSDRSESIQFTTLAAFHERLQTLLSNIEIEIMRTANGGWNLPLSLLPEGATLKVEPVYFEGKLSHYFVSEKGEKKEEFDAPLFLKEPLFFETRVLTDSVKNAKSLNDLQIEVKTKVQGIQLKGIIPWKNIEIAKATIKQEFDQMPEKAPPWAYQVNGRFYLPTLDQAEGVILPANFQKSGVKIGDRGYLAYGSSAMTSMQEQRCSVYVAGFYDPGIMAIGLKAILAPSHLVHDINVSSRTFSLDPAMTNGIQVWFNDLSKTNDFKNALQTSLDEKGLSPYWKVESFQEFDFAKDLLLQFQSDKYLFTLIGIIILLVACSNIISFLVILVKDKKREIAILQSMGASSRSTTAIFAICGASVGLISTLIGTIAAIVTLQNIDAIASFLSFIQGHEAFNVAFYGKSLPSELSREALLFILVATPLISLLAGLVPALKACRLQPSQTLRGD